MLFKAIIVDDEKLTRDYLKLNLPKIHEQWVVLDVAEDGRDALDKLREQQADLIITDIKMPVMDGLELCRKVKESYPGQKMMILSGYDEFEMAKQAIQYGVKDYLLKPIMKDELFAALDKITNELHNEKIEDLASQTMKHLSEDSKNHAVKHFIHALITENNVEIKVLHPLMYKLKISLIEGEGVIMLAALDEETIMKKAIPLSDIPIFKFILNQVSSEIAEAAGCKVSIDQDENTVILMTGEHPSELIQTCMDIYQKISQTMFKYTGITVTSGIGSMENDILNLGLSYRNARKALLSHLKNGGNTIYCYERHGEGAAAMITQSDKAVSDIASGLFERNEMNILLGIKKYVDFIGHQDSDTIFRHANYFIKTVSKKMELPMEATNRALYRLQQNINTWSEEALAVDQTILLFKEIVSCLVDPPSGSRDQDSNDLVSRAKEFILTHYSEPLSLAAIAERLDISTSYLSDLFHKTTGESYTKFLTRVRMEQAAHMLKANPREKVYIVAEKVGYVSVKHFSHVFKQHFHIPPGEYQQQL
jgi:two-component system response regulator YesN